MIIPTHQIIPYINHQVTHTQPECADTDCSHKEMHDEKHSIQFMSPCLTQRKKGSSQKRGAQRFRQESYMNNCKFTNNRWTKLDQTLINFNVNTSLLQIKLNLERASPRGWFVNGLNLGAQSFRATQTGFWITRHASRNFSCLSPRISWDRQNWSAYWTFEKIVSCNFCSIAVASLPSSQLLKVWTLFHLSKLLVFAHNTDR